MKISRTRKCWICGEEQYGHEIMYQFFPECWVCENCIKDHFETEYKALFENCGRDIKSTCNELGIDWDSVENINENLYLSTVD